jgi:carbonic anhydrase
MNAEEPFKLLKEGNERFVNMKLKHPNESIERRENTAIYGQKPFAIVLACSDSRVPVEIILPLSYFL